MLRASTLRKNRIRQSLFAQVIDIDRSCSGAVASTHNDKVTKRWRKIDHEHSDIGRGRTACAACTFSVVHNTQTCQTHTTHNRFTVTSVESAAECGLHVVSQAFVDQQ